MKQLTLHRVTLTVAIVGLALAVASFAFPSIPAGLLCFYFPVCWLLWITSAFVSVKHRLLRLLVVWFVINVSVLMMFLSVTSSLGDVSGSQGTELVWFFSYAPMFFPTALTLASFIEQMKLLAQGLSHYFEISIVRVLSDWFQFSIIAAVQGGFIVLAANGVHTLRERRGH